MLISFPYNTRVQRFRVLRRISMTPIAVSEAAKVLSDHRRSRKPLDHLSAPLRPVDESDAYAIQDMVHRELAGTLGPIVGHKIGCTTAVMQAFLKIPNPCAGGVFERTVYHSPAIVQHSRFVRVGVECEIVARLGADLPPAATDYTRETVTSAVDALMAGMEIVDARYVDYTKLDTPTLIADDFFNAGCVLSAPVTNWRAIDVPNIVGVTYINGVEVGRGKGSDVMGHPFAALAWLANQRSHRGLGLKRGEFVFLGSVVETKWVSAGDRVVMEIEQLGKLDVRFS